MAPTRMKLRVRRRDNTAAAAAAAEGGGAQEDEQRRRREGGALGGSSRRKNASKASSPSPPASSASARAVMAAAAEEASPDSKCPICLDRFNNLAYLDRCLHRFCFPCIQEWSHNKAECPLCKQPFASILHSVRAEDDFKEYTLRPPPANSSVAATVAMVAAMASAARSNHQMRLMLRRHRVADGGETTARRRRRARGERGARRAEERPPGVWEWYLDSPPLPLHPAVSPSVVEDGEEQRIRAAAERGVIFEGLAGLEGAATPVAPNDRASRRLMTRLAARQRLQREGGAVRRLRERETVALRRALYRCGIRVIGVAGATATQGGGQQRDVTADSFRRSPALLARLRPWLRRELTVLYGAHGSLVEIVQRIITARLARHGLEDVPVIEEELRPFLLARTEHFLHELVSFARSPLSLDSYDLHAVYEPPAAVDMDWISSSSDSSSVIAISEGEEAEQEAAGGGAEGAELRAVDAAPDDVIQTGSCLSQSGWDDETPGPSYSTAEQACSLASLPASPAPQEAANQEAAEKEEECLIVGYKKPIAERTPELVQLSSDSEEEETKKATPPAPPAAPPLSVPPTIPPSTSAAFRDEPDGRPRENDGEVAAGAPSRARSWSGSSGRSRMSVCTLSPRTPAGGERRHDKASWRERRESRERRRKRRRRRRRMRGPERKSGTIYNPNRSIFPAMMRHRSPFHSSTESGSPTSPAPSSWECRSSQLEALSSSDSSPSCTSSSSSALCFSPPPLQTPPPTSPGDCEDGRHGHGEKPGGKRKYKSRHLDSDVKDPTWRPSGSQKRRRKGRSSGAAASSRRSREERSPSVEIIYEGAANASRAPAGRRHQRRRRRAQRGSSPVIITLDSDSSHGNINHHHRSSSSPISSRRSVDFSDLPPLPLVHPVAVGGALEAELGELPVDILDRGSDGSEAEPSAGGVRAELNGPIRAGEGSDPDRNLLTAILDDLRGLSARRPAPTFDPGCSPDSRVQRYRTPCEVGHDRRSPAGCPSILAAPTLERRRDRGEMPPLLQQAPPTLPFNRNTPPPPLKHKDGGSPSVCLAERRSAPPCPSGGASLTVGKATIPAFCTLRRLPSGGGVAARAQQADTLEAPHCDLTSGGRCELTPSPEEVSPPGSRTQTGSWPAARPLPPLASKPSMDQLARHSPLRPAPSPSDPPRPPSPPQPQNHLDPESGLQPPPKLDLLLRGASAGQSGGCMWSTDAHAAT